MTERIQVAKYPVSAITIVVFNDGEAHMKYENLGPRGLINTLFKVLEQFITSKFDEQQIVQPEEIDPSGIGPAGGNGG